LILVCWKRREVHRGTGRRVEFPYPDFIWPPSVDFVLGRNIIQVPHLRLVRLVQVKVSRCGVDFYRRRVDCESPGFNGPSQITIRQEHVLRTPNAAVGLVLF
jgi:hypothetical protein